MGDLRTQYYAIRDHYLPWLTRNGYASCQVIAKANYRGSVWPYRWIRALKSGRAYLIFEKDERERKEKKLCPIADLKAVLEKLPAASKITEIIPFKAKLLVVVEEGTYFTNLWEIERRGDLPSYTELETALTSLVKSLEEINWVHGDIRPWNIFFEPSCRRFLFIDWWSSEHRNLENAKRDRQDVKNMLDLFRGTKTLEKAWGRAYFTTTWNPTWVKRGRAPKGIKSAESQIQSE